MASGYETLFITHPEIADEELQELIDKFKDVIFRAGGDFLRVEKWGKRKLMYKIKGLSKGCFVRCCFLGNQVLLQEIDRLLRYNERVLRYQTIKLDKKINIESLREKEEKENLEVANIERGSRTGENKQESPEGTQEETLA